MEEIAYTPADYATDLVAKYGTSTALIIIDEAINFQMIDSTANKKLSELGNTFNDDRKFLSQTRDEVSKR